MSTFFLHFLFAKSFTTFIHGLGALALILGASPQTRLRGIERGFFGAPAETALNNPLEGTQPVKIYCA